MYWFFFIEIDAKYLIKLNVTELIQPDYNTNYNKDLYRVIKKNKKIY